MKLPLIIAILALCVVAYAPAVPAQAVERHYSSYQDDFMSGYRQGYDKGAEDMRSGLNFDYESSDAYQSGTNDFQSGFQEGYQDAFGRRSPQIDMQNRDAVEIFSATGFRGHAMTMGVGSYDSINLDDVESLRIYGDVRVILFNRPDFEGRSVTLSADAPNLRDMQKSNTFWTFGLLKHHTGSMIIEPLR